MSERKNKYIGFRVTYDDFLSVVTHTQNIGASISDWLTSLIHDAMEKEVKPTIENDLTPAPLQNNSVEQPSDSKNSFLTKEKLITSKQLFSEENEALLNSFY